MNRARIWVNCACVSHCINTGQMEDAMKRTDIRSRRRFIKASSILGVAAAFNPGTIRTVFANSNITQRRNS